MNESECLAVQQQVIALAGIVGMPSSVFIRFETVASILESTQGGGKLREVKRLAEVLRPFKRVVDELLSNGREADGSR